MPISKREIWVSELDVCLMRTISLLTRQDLVDEDQILAEMQEYRDNVWRTPFKKFVSELKGSINVSGEIEDDAKEVGMKLIYTWC